MHENHLEYWLAHCTLLGWYWNQKLLPWDTDPDVQISSRTLMMMATEYNMTKDAHGFPWQPAEYLLDINPYSYDTSADDLANRIDARWIDTRNGKYIDITALHSAQRTEFATDSGDPDVFCKDGHRYLLEDVWPLSVTKLEGIDVYVPKTPHGILDNEYGWRSLQRTKFHWHRFDTESRTWIPED